MGLRSSVIAGFFPRRERPQWRRANPIDASSSLKQDHLDVLEHRMRTVQPSRVGTPLAEPQKPAGQNRGLLPEQGVAAFVESEFCCVEQRMNEIGRAHV